MSVTKRECWTSIDQEQSNIRPEESTDPQGGKNVAAVGKVIWFSGVKDLECKHTTII